MLRIGCDGGTHASSNVVPEITRRMYDLFRSGNHAAAMQWQFRILELFDAMLSPWEFPDGFRAATELRGFQFGRGRQPQTSAQRADHALLSSTLQCLLADFELVERPAGGCTVQADDSSQDMVKQVVMKVMNDLKKRGAF
jgi:4-hydroxy-tetrahydrodipicolinate synthase